MARHRLLIVEDESEIVALIRLSADLAGFDSHSVGAVDEIGGALSSFAPTVLLVDLNIVGGTGIKVMRPLADARATMPMAIMSGSGASDHIEADARRMGLNVVGRLDKPFRRGELRAVLEQLQAAAESGSP